MKFHSCLEKAYHCPLKDQCGAIVDISPFRHFVLNDSSAKDLFDATLDAVVGLVVVDVVAVVVLVVADVAVVAVVAEV